MYIYKHRKNPACKSSKVGGLVVSAEVSKVAAGLFLTVVSAEVSKVSAGLLAAVSAEVSKVAAGLLREAEELLGAWPLWVVEVAGLSLTTLTASAASLAAGFFETGAWRGTDKNSNNRLKLEQHTDKLKCLACRAAGFFWLPTFAIGAYICSAIYSDTCMHPEYHLGMYVGPSGPFADRTSDLFSLGRLQLAAWVFLEPLAAWLLGLGPLAAWLLGSAWLIQH